MEMGTEWPFVELEEGGCFHCLIKWTNINQKSTESSGNADICGVVCHIRKAELDRKRF